MGKETARLARIIIFVILLSCAANQLVGSFLPRPERRGAVAASLALHEILFGMGGGYSFFTEASYWRGESLTTRVSFVDASGSKSVRLDEWLSPAGRLRARFLEYPLLWKYFESDRAHLEGVADRIAVHVFARLPEEIREVTVSQVEHVLPSRGDRSAIIEHAWHSSSRRRE